MIHSLMDLLKVFLKVIIGFLFSLRGGHQPASRGSNDTGLRVAGGGSMPSICGGMSASGSPRLSRARSQPCINTDRRSLKRRREERPTLDLLKMQQVSMGCTKSSDFRFFRFYDIYRSAVIDIT